MWIMMVRAYNLSCCRDHPLIHLNYAVFLFNSGDRSGATKELRTYNPVLKSHKPTTPDPEVREEGELVG